MVAIANSFFKSANLVVDDIVVAQYTDVLLSVPSCLRGIGPGGTTTGKTSATGRLKGIAEPLVPALRLVAAVTSEPGV